MVRPVEWCVLLVCALAVAAPRFSVERGLLETPFELGIEATEGGEIELVVGPDGPWQSYPGPLWIEGTTVVRAVEVVDGERSEEEVHSYLFIDQVVLGLDPQVVESDGEAIHATLRELPSVSILSDEALSLDEQMVSVEWLDPQGEDLQVFSGARKVGGHSLEKIQLFVPRSAMRPKEAKSRNTK